MLVLPEAHAHPVDGRACRARSSRRAARSPPPARCRCRNAPDHPGGDLEPIRAVRVDSGSPWNVGQAHASAAKAGVTAAPGQLRRPAPTSGCSTTCTNVSRRTSATASMSSRAATCSTPWGAPAPVIQSRSVPGRGSRHGSRRRQLHRDLLGTDEQYRQSGTVEVQVDLARPRAPAPHQGDRLRARAVTTPPRPPTAGPARQVRPGRTRGPPRAPGSALPAAR